MYGYACLETDELLPLPVVLAHRLTRLLTDARKGRTIRGLGPDGKAQVSVEYVFGLPSRITSVVISCQHEPDKDSEGPTSGGHGICSHARTAGAAPG